MAFVRFLRGLGATLVWALYLSLGLTLAEMIRVTGCPAGHVEAIVADLMASWIVISEHKRGVTRYRLSYTLRRRLYPFAGLY